MTTEEGTEGLIRVTVNTSINHIVAEGLNLPRDSSRAR